MSKLRALELSLDLFRIGDASAATADAVLVTAGLFAAFLGEETPAKPATTRARKTTDAPPAVSVEQEKPVDPTPEVKQAAQTAGAAALAATGSTQVAAAVAAVDVAAATSSAVTEADVKAAVGKLATKAAAGGAPKARAILNACGGATNISTLKPEFYAKAKADIDAVLAAADIAA